MVEKVERFHIYGHRYGGFKMNNYADEQAAREEARDKWIAARAAELMAEMDDGWMGDALHHLDFGLQGELVIQSLRLRHGQPVCPISLLSGVIEHLYRQLESYALDCAEKEAGEL